MIRYNSLSIAFRRSVLMLTLSNNSLCQIHKKGVPEKRCLHVDCIMKANKTKLRLFLRADTDGTDVPVIIRRSELKQQAISLEVTGRAILFFTG
jgi:hypothetical protein